MSELMLCDRWPQRLVALNSSTCRLPVSVAQEPRHSRARSSDSALSRAAVLPEGSTEGLLPKFTPAWASGLSSLPGAVLRASQRGSLPIRHTREARGRACQQDGSHGQKSLSPDVAHLHFC